MEGFAFSTSQFEIPFPNGAEPGYGSALIVPSNSGMVLFSYIEPPSAMRLCSVDVQKSEVRFLKGVPGLLRSSVSTSPDTMVLLTTHGLCRISIDPLKIIAVNKKGIPKWARRLYRLSDQHLGLSTVHSKTVLVIDQDSLLPISRFSFPSADTTLKVGTETYLCSFNSGKAARYAQHALPIKKADFVNIPVGSPGYLSKDGHIFFLGGSPFTKEQFSQRHTHCVSKDGINYDVAYNKTIGCFKFENPVEIKTATITEFLSDILGTDYAGRIIAKNDRQITLFDSNNLSHVGTYMAPKHISGAALVGNKLVAYLQQLSNSITGLCYLSW